MINNYVDIDTEEGSSSGRGAKGSIRDRLISIMFRKRYEKLKLQKEFYSKNNIDKKIDYIKTIKDFEIDKTDTLDDEDKSVIKSINFIIPIIPLNDKKIDIYIPEINNEKETKTNNINEDIQELHNISEKIINTDPKYELNGREIEVDPDTEVFDFDKYDYYEMEDLKYGIDIENSEEDYKIIDIEKEEKISNDEKVIVEKLEEFIDESIILLDELKEEVKVIQDEVTKPYTIEQALKLEERSNNLRKKIDNLKLKYDSVNEKYDFKDFAILDSIEFMDAVDDYLDSEKLATVEVMVQVCKNEIEKIEGIVIEKDCSVKVATDIEDKKEEIEKRTLAFHKNKDETKKQEKVEDIVAIELIEQRKILEDIKSRVDKVEEVVIPKVRITGYGRMFASILRIAAGIITTPISNRRIFGIALGTALINRGLRGLRQGLTVEQNEERIIKYQDLEQEIINQKDKLEYVNVMLLDSISQVDKLKEEFSLKFEKYVYLIPEYKDAMNKLDNLKKKLEQKHIEIKTIDKDLNLQRKKNNERVRKLENR